MYIYIYIYMYNVFAVLDDRPLQGRGELVGACDHYLIVMLCITSSLM